MDEQGYQARPCPIATMDAFGREFLAGCHAEAQERAVQVGRDSSPCMYVNCGRDYEWHVREGVYWRYEDDPVTNPSASGPLTPKAVF